MAYETDEEQIEAIKRWWRENGTTLIVSVAVVVLAVLGWRQWDTSREAAAAQASDLYQQMANVAAVGSGQEITDEDLQQAREINTRLRDDFSGSIYSRYAALFMAKLHVESGDLDSAEAQLNWVLDNRDLGMLQSAEEELFLTARLRLARVALAKEEPRRALQLLEGADPGALAGSYAEAEGDAYMALGEEENAREAYERAIESGGNNALVELKLRDLSAT